MPRFARPPARALLTCLALGGLLSACGGGETATGPEPSPPDPEPEPNEPPTAEIISPSDGATFTEGNDIRFEGNAEDPEEGELPGSSMVWESSLDGRIGTGQSPVLSSPSVGNHEVTLTVTDSEGAEDADTIQVTVEEKVVTPEVTLGVKLPRPDLEFSESAEIAHREAIVLEWSSENEPETCTASGGWSGSKSASGTDTTSALPGPAEEEFIIRCENSAGADADTVSVDIGAPGERHATSNRPDENERDQVKLFYVVNADGRDRELDLEGEIQSAFRRFQEEFERQTGERFRVDSFSGGYDVAFVDVDFDDYPELSSASDIIREEVKKRGLYNRKENGGYKTLIFHYDGLSPSGSFNACGNGGATEAYLWLAHCELEFSTQGHELLHSLGFVDEDAPNFEQGGHVTDHEDDLMDNSASNDFIVDYNRDDYFNRDGLPPEIKNLAESPFLLD